MRSDALQAEIDDLKQTQIPALEAEIADLKQQHPVPATTTVWVHGSAARIEGWGRCSSYPDPGDPVTLQISGQHQATFKVAFPAPPAWRARGSP